MAEGEGRGRGQLRSPEVEMPARGQDLGIEDEVPNAARAMHDAATARTAWLETIRTLARCMARQDHDRLIREDDSSRI